MKFYVIMTLFNVLTTVSGPIPAVDAETCSTYAEAQHKAKGARILEGYRIARPEIQKSDIAFYCVASSTVPHYKYSKASECESIPKK